MEIETIDVEITSELASLNIASEAMRQKIGGQPSCHHNVTVNNQDEYFLVEHKNGEIKRFPIVRSKPGVIRLLRLMTWLLEH